MLEVHQDCGRCSCVPDGVCQFCQGPGVAGESNEDPDSSVRARPSSVVGCPETHVDCGDCQCVPNSTCSWCSTGTPKPVEPTGSNSSVPFCPAPPGHHRLEPRQGALWTAAAASASPRTSVATAALTCSPCQPRWKTGPRSPPACPAALRAIGIAAAADALHGTSHLQSLWGLRGAGVELFLVPRRAVSSSS